MKAMKLGALTLAAVLALGAVPNVTEGFAAETDGLFCNIGSKHLVGTKNPAAPIWAVHFEYKNFTIEVVADAFSMSMDVEHKGGVFMSLSTQPHPGETIPKSYNLNSWITNIEPGLQSVPIECDFFTP